MDLKKFSLTEKEFNELKRRLKMDDISEEELKEIIDLLADRDVSQFTNFDVALYKAAYKHDNKISDDSKKIFNNYFNLTSKLGYTEDTMPKMELSDVNNITNMQFTNIVINSNDRSKLYEFNIIYMNNINEALKIIMESYSKFFDFIDGPFSILCKVNLPTKNIKDIVSKLNDNTNNITVFESTYNISINEEFSYEFIVTRDVTDTIQILVNTPKLHYIFED